MISKAQIKYIQSLRRKKIRNQHQVFILEGTKIALETILESPSIIQYIIATQTWFEKHQTQLQQSIAQRLIAQPSELKKISNLINPSDVLILANQFQPIFRKEKINDFILYLDNIQDPGNMGTILRIADWFGIEYVICNNGCVDLYNPKVIQSSMGAFLRVKCIEIDAKSFFETYTELPVYGTFLEGKNVFTIAPPRKGVIVIGNEGKGISEEIHSFITQKICIPAHNSGSESLNAAVATGIICAAFRNIC